MSRLPSYGYIKNTNTPSSKKEVECFRCKKLFPTKDLIETIGPPPEEPTEYYCEGCLSFLDNYFKSERKKI